MRLSRVVLRFSALHDRDRDVVDAHDDTNVGSGNSSASRIAERSAAGGVAVEASNGGGGRHCGASRSLRSVGGMTASDQCTTAVNH